MTTDLFSKQAVEYAKFRPLYPAEIYSYLAGVVPARELAWDCATGNGQAAVGLSDLFKQVIATDLSSKQIENADARANIDYRVLRAEESLKEKDGSIDLVTVAQALHWFDIDRFYAEVNRALKPGGIFATWAYGFHAPIQPEIDRLLHAFYFETLGPYWKGNNRHIWNGYESIPFPFERLQAPKPKMAVTWNLDELLGYFTSWSATQLYLNETGEDPTAPLRKKLESHWGDPRQSKSLHWDLTFLVGRKKTS